VQAVTTDVAAPAENSADDQEAAEALAVAVAKHGDGATALKAGDFEAALDLFGDAIGKL